MYAVRPQSIYSSIQREKTGWCSPKFLSVHPKRRKDATSIRTSTRRSMANTKSKSKGRKKRGRGRGKAISENKSPVSISVEEPCRESGAVDVLLEEARNVGDPFVAVGLYQRLMRARPDDASIMGEAADLMLHTGDTAGAKEVLARSISLEPEEGPDKYLYMAQLHEGREALGFYEKGVELLQKKLNDGASRTKEAETALKQRLCVAFCSIGELFLTDLCFEEDAETRCQDALEESMRYDYGGPEPLCAIANLRLSQSKANDAAESAQKAFRRLGLCEPPPDHEFRVSLAKVLLECSSAIISCSEQALRVLSDLMQEDDENVELWYLMAVAFNNLQPPDYESARARLKTAAEMLSKIRATQEEMGEEFTYEEQVQLVQEQLEITGLLESEDGGKSSSVQEMDCA